MTPLERIIGIGGRGRCWLCKWGVGCGVWDVECGVWGVGWGEGDCMLGYVAGEINAGLDGLSGL